MVTIDFNDIGTTIEAYYLKCICAGRAYEGLRASWQKQLRDVQDEIGFEYIRFHGIFHDDMAIYNENENGEPEFFWQYFDELFDFLKEVKLKPIFELGFMPSHLATKKDTVFWWHANGCPPTDYDKWSILVKEVVLHSIERYGIEAVKTWYFEVWNEPNLDSFWQGTQEEYFKLYEYSANAIKAIDEDLKIGGPSTSGADFRESEEHLPYFEAFIDFCIKKQLPIDFFTAHPYPTYWPLDTKGNKSMGYMDKESTKRHLRLVRRIVDSSPFYNAEIHLTEWNSSPSPRDLIHDTPFMAPFILYNCLQNIGLVDSLGFWTFTDIFEENGPGKSLFHGGFGLVNCQGIKKPAYWAYYFLSQLGNEILFNNENMVVARKNDDLQIILFDFCYYKDEFSSGNRENLTKVNRDEVFEDKSITVKFEINNLLHEYEEKVYRLGKNYGSALHHWIAKNAPESPAKEEADELISISKPVMVSENKVQHVYCREFSLDPHDVIFITLSTPFPSNHT